MSEHLDISILREKFMTVWSNCPPDVQIKMVSIYSLDTVNTILDSNSIVNYDVIVNILRAIENEAGDLNLLINHSERRKIIPSNTKGPYMAGKIIVPAWNYISFLR
ncbi:hypothetical protein [Tenacibaculum agarivorans]|uniref:hypothetical protein n=1 Tax=Tenacibaculum agarivorans TaxID=1908389 RepID=UPI00094B987E|nr:hypothetical protein [Tenacibaculum agarivorans]